jgi:ABC-type nitrate/sulfonate/bicarbonate transport system substrate-binding protein
MRLRYLAFPFIAGLIASACGGGGAAPSAAPTAAATAATQAVAPAPTAAPKTTCQPKNITIAIPVTPPNVVHLPPYVARELGYFKDENLTVEFVRFEGGVGSLRAAASGGITLAGTSSEPVVDGIANGADVKILYSYAPAVDVSFVVGPRVKTLADLKGKVMGVQEPGGFADVMTRIVLKKAGVDPKDVTFKQTTTAARVQQVIQGVDQGGTDTAVLHIDQTKVAQKQNPALSVLVNMWEILADYQYSVWVAPTQAVKDDPATLECTIRALIRADRAMYDPANRAKIVDIAVKEAKIDKDVAESTFDTLVKAKAWPQNEGVPKSFVEGTIKSERDFGKITKDLKFEDVVDLSIVKRILAQLGPVKDFPY